MCAHAPVVGNGVEFHGPAEGGKTDKLDEAADRRTEKQTTLS